MFNVRNIGCCGVLVCVALAWLMPGQALGQTADIFSFAFDNLNADYESTSGVLSIVAETGSTGSVARTWAPAETAVFESASGKFTAELMVSAMPALGDVYVGIGDFLITDNNGDTISGGLSGLWTRFGGSFVNFTGELSDVYLNELSGDGGIFDGTSVGAFDMEFPMPEPYGGGITDLAFTQGSWFDDDFNEVVSILAYVTPEPSTLLLALVGAGATLCRRR